MPVLWVDRSADVNVVQLTAEKDISELVRLFEKIAAEEAWEPGDALQQMRREQKSMYFGLIIHGRLVGGLQLILPDKVGRLPSHHVWPDVPLVGSTRNNAAHIAILALEAPVRGQALLFWRLVIEMWRYCIAEGIVTLFIEVTPRVLPLYRRLGWPLMIVGELRRHWGEDCHLCTLGIPEVAVVLLRRSGRSAFYREIIAQAFRVTVAVVVRGPIKQQRPTSVVRESNAAYAVW